MIVFTTVREPKTRSYRTGLLRIPTQAYLSQEIERSPNTKSVTKVTRFSIQDRVMVGPPSTSPVDGKILFWVIERSKPGSLVSNIWQLDEGSRNRRRITSGSWFDNSPCYSKEGDYIYFSSNRTSLASKIWRIRSQGGGGITKVTQGRSFDDEPSLTPNDKKVVYSSLPPRAKGNQIWIADASSGMPTVLREGLHPRVSPDGKNILFLRKDKLGKRMQLWMMDRNGGLETQLTQNSDYDIRDASWSPDGKSIVFASNEGYDANGLRNFDIWLMDIDGNEPTQLTTNGSWDDSPVFDRTGETIFFRSNREGVFNIWKLELNRS